MDSNGTNGTNGTKNSWPWQSEFHPTIISLACIIILFNIPIILLFLKVSTLRYSAGNTFLVGLAFADILCATIMIPAGLLCEINVFSEKDRLAMCRFYYISNYTISSASVYHIVAATMAKYFAIISPVKNITMLTSSRVKYTIVLIWLTAFLAGHLPAYWPLMTMDEIMKMIKIHAIFMLLFACAIPTLILLLVHVHIFAYLYLKPRPQALAGTTRQTTLAKNNRKFVIIFLVLFSVFLISWLPWYLMGAGLISNENDYVISLRFVAPILNPLVFTFIKQDFRKAVVSVFRGMKRNANSRSFSMRSSNTTKAESSPGEFRSSMHV